MSRFGSTKIATIEFLELSKLPEAAKPFSM